MPNTLIWQELKFVHTNADIQKKNALLKFKDDVIFLKFPFLLSGLKNSFKYFQGTLVLLGSTDSLGY